jgi:hypothetical protein
MIKQQNPLVSGSCRNLIIGLTDLNERKANLFSADYKKTQQSVAGS